MAKPTVKNQGQGGFCKCGHHRLYHASIGPCMVLNCKCSEWVEAGARMSNKICGYECYSSTSIGGWITHGWGRLDNNGHWEVECPETDGKHVAFDNQVYRALGEEEYVRAEPKHEAR